MKPLEISEEQKEKLLEMCKVLFPEYERYCFWGTENQPYVGMYNVDEYGEELSENNCSIHWFEFCNTWLAEKIVGCQSNLVRALNEENTGEHPIDYLYEQFKQL